MTSFTATMRLRVLARITPNITIPTFVVVGLFIFGCSASRQTPQTPVTIDPDQVAKSTPSQAELEPTQTEMLASNAAQEVALENVVAEDSSVEPTPDEDNDAEFCRDNLYAQYLKNQYLQKNATAQNPEKAFKPKYRSRRRVATRSPYDVREVEALFYARSRLVGETVPYFGAIPVVTNPRVEYWIRYFKNNGRKAFLRWLVRGESVKNVVLPILKQQGLPPEFIFLSMVESGFSNSAYSRARATGPWQFMPGTAKLYGLKMSPWVDERRDPAKSTLAAAQLLSDLYREFGDWYLAMAAYNAGSGRLRSAIRKAQSSNFWEIANSPYLPVETKNYVPKVLAALMLASNPQGHGFEVVADPLDVLPTSEVELNQPASIQEIARKFQITERMLRHWNPELIHAVTPPGSRPYRLRISSNLTEKWADISQQISYLDIKDVLIHKVRRGDTLVSIASRYRTDVNKLLNMNPGLTTGRLKIGREITVPTTYALSAPKPDAEKLRKLKRQARSG